MAQIRRMELTDKNVELLAQCVGTDAGTLFKKLPKLMGWDDDVVLSMLGYEMG